MVPADRGEVAYRWCPPGTFTMGTPLTDPGFQPEEEQVSVRITRGFWMGETEVTQSLYSEVTGTNPAPLKGDDLPVFNVKWKEASEFCDQLSLRDRKAGVSGFGRCTDSPPRPNGSTRAAREPRGRFMSVEN